jgi:hypothetical protein
LLLAVESALTPALPVPFVPASPPGATPALPVPFVPASPPGATPALPVPLVPASPPVTEVVSEVAAPLALSLLLQDVTDKIVNAANRQSIDLFMWLLFFMQWLNNSSSQNYTTERWCFYRNVGRNRE